MNILRELAEATRQQKSTNYMKKVGFRKQDKTISHKCSQCTRVDAKKYRISEKEVRWLCPVHFDKFTNITIEKPNFLKAKHIQVN